MKLFTLGVCCNAPENGMSEGRADCFEIYAPSDNECQGRLDGPPVTCYLKNSHRLKLGRITLKIFGYKEWVGNWCWDQAYMPYSEIKRAIDYLQRRGHTPEESTEWFDNLWILLNKRRKDQEANP